MCFWFGLFGFFFFPLLSPLFQGVRVGWGGGGVVVCFVFSTSVECRPMTPFSPLPFFSLNLSTALSVFCCCCFFICFFFSFLFFFVFCFCLSCFWLFGGLFFFWGMFLFFFPSFSWGGGGARFFFILVFPPSVAWSFLPSSFYVLVFVRLFVYFWIFSFLSLVYFVCRVSFFFFFFSAILFIFWSFFFFFCFVFCWVSISFCFCLGFMFLVLLRLVFLWERNWVFYSLFCFLNINCKQTYDTWRLGHVVPEDIVIADKH